MESKTVLRLNSKATKIFNKLIEKLVYESDTSEAYTKLESEGFMPLSIEDVSWQYGVTAYSMSHTGVQNGDLMRDPEVVFFKVDDMIIPAYFRNDYVAVEHDAFKIKDGIMYAHKKLHPGLVKFCNMWMNNIKEQGFLE